MENVVVEVVGATAHSRRVPYLIRGIGGGCCVPRWCCLSSNALCKSGCRWRQKKIRINSGCWDSRCSVCCCWGMVRRHRRGYLRCKNMSGLRKSIWRLRVRNCLRIRKRWWDQKRCPNTVGKHLGISELSFSRVI